MSTPPMHRRDFLLLRTRGRQRVLELSCERLYMRWADARSGVGGLGVAAGSVASGAAAGGAAPRQATDHQPWDGEPPIEIVTMTSDDLLTELERELTRADVLRVLGREWLSDPDFREDVEARVEAFRSSGGRVE